MRAGWRESGVRGKITNQELCPVLLGYLITESARGILFFVGRRQLFQVIGEIPEILGGPEFLGGIVTESCVERVRFTLGLNYEAGGLGARLCIKRNLGAMFDYHSRLQSDVLYFPPASPHVGCPSRPRYTGDENACENLKQQPEKIEVTILLIKSKSTFAVNFGCQNYYFGFGKLLLSPDYIVRGNFLEK